MKKETIVHLGVLILLRSPACHAQFDDLWELCPTVEHQNCDTAIEIRADACGTTEPLPNSTCNCRQAFIDSYVNCQAEFTSCTGDEVIKPNEWEDLFALWQDKGAALISAGSLTMPTPTTTLSPAERSQAPLASCDVEGIDDRAVICDQVDRSFSSCFSITVDAVDTLGAFPCLCDGNLLRLMDECNAELEDQLTKCGYSTTVMGGPTQLRSTCSQLGLTANIVATATVTTGTSTLQGTSTPSITFAPLGPASTTTSRSGGELSSSLHGELVAAAALVLVTWW